MNKVLVDAVALASLIAQATENKRLIGLVKRVQSSVRKYTEAKAVVADTAPKILGGAVETAKEVVDVVNRVEETVDTAKTAYRNLRDSVRN